jgi:hypothetical protein
LSVGFPWISLDSLVRIETYQWVTLDFRGCEFFSRLSLALTGRRTGACGLCHAEAQDCSWGKPTHISDFLQDIVAFAAPFGLNPKAARLSYESSGHPASSLASRYGLGISGFDAPLN